MRKTIAAAGIGVLIAAGLAACGPDATTTDQQNTNAQLLRYQANQPVPQFDRSQYRQTVIDVESAQVHGVATTTFFFNLGVTAPIKVCPSIGFPVASTSQLTNPLQSQTGGPVAQAEPNGVFTGDSSGTYVVCVASNGQRYISYWEGDVHTEGGPAHWDYQHNMIVMDGVPTVTTK